MKSINDYLALVTSQHADKPNYNSILSGVLQPFVDAQTYLAGLSAAFDVDYAIGVQLDVVGEWVGINRSVPVPISNTFFSFGDARRGFGLGYWADGYAQAYGIQSFDDTTYRRLIRAKIMANQGDGSVASAIAILNTFLEGAGATFFAYGSDSGMSGAPAAGARLTIGFSGALPSFIYMIVIAREYLPLRGAGVELNTVGTTVSGAPCFGFGVENQYVSGFGVGAWARDPDYLIQNL